MISVQQIVKSYGNYTAVNIPSLDIPAGQSFGLVGNNGAGKTTLFRMLLDLVKPTAGQVLSEGQDVAGNEAWKHYTGAYLDEGFLLGHLTPNEYFEFVGTMFGLNKAELEERLAPFSDFFNGEIREKKAYIRDLSKGNQKKVGIAAAMMVQPRVLVLDEPFANLDPTTQIRLKQLLKRYHAEHGATLLISSHDLNHVTEVCERIVILEKGQVVQDMACNADTLQVLEAYFTV
jgi:ABC-2 type transport system ATP-binding protein